MLLRCENISKSIGGKVILNNISFSIQRNTINFIIGPNAAGKTSLGRIIAGYDDDYTGKLFNEARDSQQFVPNVIKINSYLPLSVMDFIQLFDGFNVNDISDFICFDSIVNKQLSELSAGQLHKLFLVVSLSISSLLIVFDEPTSTLDPVSCNKFFLLLKKYINVTFIVISHDLHMVSSFADQVICINKHICCVKSIDCKSTDFIRYYHQHDHEH
ncbi:MAG: ATP-binding cassette domain-containing protein [Pseudomonadota bacterium]